MATSSIDPIGIKPLKLLVGESLTDREEHWRLQVRTRMRGSKAKASSGVYHGGGPHCEWLHYAALMRRNTGDCGYRRPFGEQNHCEASACATSVKKNTGGYSYRYTRACRAA
ncbi:hypothetical protein N7494_013191 [Penicillium frequentans]|uniref:Uncharacterized protein n=1 Tax=Penicillium frequentans TaxID=3151616 RepID=A0AAD6CHL4_9EURO|nr:hypothetical protein N7494_013191 [Penicillium glabrum]